MDKMERQPAEWEKLFANDMTDKDLIFQNIQTAPYQQDKQPKQKMGRRH